MVPDSRTPKGRFALDLVVVVGVTVLLAVSWLRGPPDDRAGRVLVSMLVIGYAFSVPGYALLAALFVRRDEPYRSIKDSVPRGGERIDARSRAVLSVGLSPILVGVVAVAVDQSPLALEGVTVLSTLAAFVLLCVGVAAIRRASLPAETRYRPAVGFGLPGVSTGSFSTGRAVFVGIAVASVLVAGGSLAHTAVTWEPGERFTELSVLTPGESDELVASGYDSSDRLVVVIGNHEYRQMNYTVVVRRQLVSVDSGTGTASVIEELNRSRARVSGLPHGEERQVPIRQTASTGGRPVRLGVFLYRGSGPRNASAESAYRTTSLWFNVPDDSGAR